jgi:hypothetical protein
MCSASVAELVGALPTWRKSPILSTSAREALSTNQLRKRSFGFVPPFFNSFYGTATARRAGGKTNPALLSPAPDTLASSHPSSRDFHVGKDITRSWEYSQSWRRRSLRSGASSLPACRPVEKGGQVSAISEFRSVHFFRQLTSHLASRRSVSPLLSAAILASSFRLRRTARAAMAR